MASCSRSEKKRKQGKELPSRSWKKAKGLSTMQRPKRGMESCSKAEGVSTTMQPNWLELPREITVNILEKLSDVEDMMNASQVCSSWWNIYKDPHMWRNIDMTVLPFCSNAKLQQICAYAVERSCGHLEEISISLFASADLLNYIADSSSHLRRLRLPGCQGILEKRLIEVAKKFPLLEELDISHTEFTKDSLLAFGRYCPYLKALKFSNWRLSGSFLDEEYAFAIAKTMPELRRLDVSGNYLTNQGFVAIRDGCPLLDHLTSRDLLYCEYHLSNC